MSPSEPKEPSARPSLWSAREGLPVALLAGLALVASALGRLIAPALFGAATGLERWIMVTQAAANLSTQIAAAAGVALTLRAVGATLGRPTLGIAYRMVAIPAAIATSALTMAAAGRVLDPPLVSALAVSAIVTAAVATPFLLATPPTRAMGLVLGLTAFSGALDFAGVRLSTTALEAGSVRLYRTASALVTSGFVLEVLLVALVFSWIAARRRLHAALLGGVSALFALGLVWALHATSTASGSASEVVVARAMTSLLRAPAPYVPPAARLMLEAASTVGAVAALFATRRAPFAPLVSLCLLARGSLDIPIPALLLVVAALALPAYGPLPPLRLPRPPRTGVGQR